jgi:hypothetical protein
LAPAPGRQGGRTCRAIPVDWQWRGLENFGPRCLKKAPIDKALRRSYVSGKLRPGLKSAAFAGCNGATCGNPFDPAAVPEQTDIASEWFSIFRVFLHLTRTPLSAHVFGKDPV